MTTAPTLRGSLSVRNAHVSAGSFKILQGISFTLHPGEMCGIIGPSGAGKSTLIKVLLGLRRPDPGEVTLGGGPVQSAGPVGYVPQDDALHRSLRVAETLEYAARLRLPELDTEGRAARIDEVCREVGLEERRGVRVGRLSGGQRKRVSVALELLTRPPLLILDEPTSGLDPGLEARMMGLFSDLARQGNSVLVSTHAMQSLKRCDLLMVLVSGQLAFFAPPAEAPEYFQTDSFAGVFERLALRKPAGWHRAWSESPLRRQVEARATPALPAPGEAAPAPPVSAPPVSAPPVAAAPSAEAPTPSRPPAPEALTPEQQLAALKAKLGRPT
ncbi:MAG: ABC transporter ATP-binding protein [Alphaproteobacteria bacterium]|nr:ABC transporter ATP-binding protein [Alphaproteobacteria bacterium]